MLLPERFLNGSNCVLCSGSIAKIPGLGDAPDGEMIFVYCDGEFDGGAWAHYQCTKGYEYFDLTGRGVGEGGNPYWFPLGGDNPFAIKVPEIGQTVWVWLPTVTDGETTGMTTIGRIESFASDNSLQWKVHGFGVYAGETITHWTPLPLLPPAPR